MNNERNSINYLIDDIQRIQREMGLARDLGIQAEDREAFEIIRRIERRLKGKARKPQQAAE